ncbi:hypothetical protein [Streptomyces zingiberis]|uniref:2'-5' RNA ligase family protein n=1 Tax=Streptomyces zingiberis TaxID=2053010 RepID=A0ABX1BU85_9ACTN|nr:hypothetical protein [Streptomyces zingiberis]NJP99424.1 hypothetical protein [Streptomyces zingiberis]
MRRGRPGARPRAAEERGRPDAVRRNGTGPARSTVPAAAPVTALTVPAAPGAEPGSAPGAEPERREPSRLWHVTLSLAGERTPPADVRRGLERLAHDHPFLLTGRYAADHAEIRYWEEARDLHDAAAVALRLWGEHRATAGLPPWEIVGLEVVDRDTYHQRVTEGYGRPPVSPIGVHPF